MPVDGSAVPPPVREPVVPSPPVRGGGAGVLLAPTTSALVEEQLARVEARLLREAEDDPAALDVRRHLSAARARFATATVTQFLPILVEREARRRIREERRALDDTAGVAAPCPVRVAAGGVPRAAASGVRTEHAVPPR